MKEIQRRTSVVDASAVRSGDALYVFKPERWLCEQSATIFLKEGSQPTYNDHFFYVHRLDGVKVLLVPCSSSPTRDSVKLDPVGKLGHPQWTCQVTFVLVSQIWVVERDVLALAASGPVHSTYGRNCVKYGWRSKIDAALSRGVFSQYPFNPELN
jgi:hypothetical protein